MRSAFLLAALVAACDATPVPVTNCTPGVQTPCACPGGSSGAQRCNDTGSAFEACMCRDAEPPVDVTTDAVAVADAPADGQRVDASADATGDGGGDVVAVADGSGDVGDAPADVPCMGQPGLTRCEAPSAGCFDLQTEVIHCGRCHNFCQNDTPRCVGGACVP